GQGGWLARPAAADWDSAAATWPAPAASASRRKILQFVAPSLLCENPTPSTLFPLQLQSSSRRGYGIRAPRCDSGRPYLHIQGWRDRVRRTYAAGLPFPVPS